MLRRILAICLGILAGLLFTYLSLALPDGQLIRLPRIIIWIPYAIGWTGFSVLVGFLIGYVVYLVVAFGKMLPKINPFNFKSEDIQEGKFKEVRKKKRKRFGLF